jgi:hypothetical protein
MVYVHFGNCMSLTVYYSSSVTYFGESGLGPPALTRFRVTIFFSLTRRVFSVGIDTSRHDDLVEVHCLLEFWTIRRWYHVISDQFNPFSTVLCPSVLWHFSTRNTVCFTGFVRNLTVTDTKFGVLGLRVPMVYFRGLSCYMSWPWPCLGIGWKRPLLDWVTESVADPANSGGHESDSWHQGGREIIPIGRRTTTLHTCFTCWAGLFTV